MSYLPTLVTCWYQLKSKFAHDTYGKWINNIMSLTHNKTFNLVIYTDDKKIVSTSDNIIIVNLPKEQWYNYKYADHWIDNQRKNILLSYIDWELNCLWSEKISFVKRAKEAEYFPNAQWYIWCDIGYFRNRVNDTPIKELSSWPNQETLCTFDTTKIHYGIVNNNCEYIAQLFNHIQNKNDIGLPRIQIPQNQTSVSGGFFIIHKDKINWYWSKFGETLEKYFNSYRLVKDDQIIVVNVMFTNTEHFQIHTEQHKEFDNWFMFQRILK